MLLLPCDTLLASSQQAPKQLSCLCCAKWCQRTLNSAEASNHIEVRSVPPSLGSYLDLKCFEQIHSSSPFHSVFPNPKTLHEKPKPCYLSIVNAGASWLVVNHHDEIQHRDCDRFTGLFDQAARVSIFVGKLQPSR